MKKYFLLLVFLPLIALSQTKPPIQASIYDSTKTNGYYYCVPFSLSVPVDYSPTQMILDNYFRIIYYRFFGAGGPLGSSTDFKIQPNGKMSYFLLNKFYILDENFKIIDSVSAKNGYSMDPHELRILPNGNYLYLAVKDTTMNLLPYKWFGDNNNEPGLPNATVKTAVIQELNSKKELVFEWVSTYPGRFKFGDVDSVWLNIKPNVDWTHSNALDVDTDGNILLSTRHFNEITKINRTTGEIMWRFGGKNNQFIFANDTIGFTGQHFIRRIANGNVTLFDNGAFTDPPVARALEYQLDEKNKIATLKWQYIKDSKVSSTAMGSVQRLENGNTLINYGFIPSSHPNFILLDNDSKPIAEVKLPPTYASYRLYNYNVLPFKLKRPRISCLKVDGKFYLTTDNHFPTYQWSNGETTQSIEIKSKGTYNVFVPYENGYISSEYFEVENINNPCNSTDIDEETGINEVSIYPNPAVDYIIYNSNSLDFVSNTIKIFNQLGECVLESDLKEASQKVNISELPQGIYIVINNTNVKKFIKY